MYIFFLAAAALILAAVLWYHQASGTAEQTPPPEENADLRLHQIIAENPRMADALAEAVQALEAVMAHPELGGPGFLLIQFPSVPDNSCAVVTAQYPNIREGLYRRIVRQELEQADLAAAGMPEALLLREPSFETESGGVVLLSVQVSGIPPEFTERLHSHRDRSTALCVLAETLEEKLPRFSIRLFGSDLLLSPDREGSETTVVQKQAAISTDE